MEAGITKEKIVAHINSLLLRATERQLRIVYLVVYEIVKGWM